MTETSTHVNGVEIAYEAFGDSADPLLLLAHGAANTMLSWHEEFCERLAEGGRHVVRYDSRDAGQSVHYPLGSPGYTSRDLAADAAALIEHLGAGPVHFAGLSMGAGTGQLLALEHPASVATLTLMSSTPVGPGDEGAGLPGPAPEIAAMFAEEGGDEPDLSTRESAIAYIAEAERPFAGPGGFDEDWHRELAGRVFDRARDLEGNLTNHFAAEDGGPWRSRLGEISVPTLVIHGGDDPFFPLGHGEALADEIPGAELLVLEGTGHEYPPRRHWDLVAEAILAHTA